MEIVRPARAIKGWAQIWLAVCCRSQALFGRAARIDLGGAGPASGRRNDLCSIGHLVTNSGFQRRVTAFNPIRPSHSDLNIRCQRIALIIGLAVLPEQGRHDVGQAGYGQSSKRWVALVIGGTAGIFADKQGLRMAFGARGDVHGGGKRHATG